MYQAGPSTVGGGGTCVPPPPPPPPPPPCAALEPGCGPASVEDVARSAPPQAAMVSSKREAGIRESSFIEAAPGSFGDRTPRPRIRRHFSSGASWSTDEQGAAAVLP